jgi:hypothetical protein
MIRRPRTKTNKVNQRTSRRNRETVPPATIPRGYPLFAALCHELSCCLSRIIFRKLAIFYNNIPLKPFHPTYFIGASEEYIGTRPRSGRGGRRFKSCHSDQTADNSVSCLIGSETHKGAPGQLSVQKQRSRLPPLTAAPLRIVIEPTESGRNWLVRFQRVNARRHRPNKRGAGNLRRLLHAAPRCAVIYTDCSLRNDPIPNLPRGRPRGILFQGP